MPKSTEPKPKRAAYIAIHEHLLELVIRKEPHACLERVTSHQSLINHPAFISFGYRL